MSSWDSQRFAAFRHFYVIPMISALYMSERESEFSCCDSAFSFLPILFLNPSFFLDLSLIFCFFLLEEIFTELYQSELELRPTWRSLKGQRNTGRVHRAKIVKFYTSDISETGALCYHAFLDKVTNNKLIKL